MDRNFKYSLHSSLQSSRPEKTFSNAWYTKKFSDITLVGEKRSFLCHRMVLSNNISFFDEILEENLNEYTKVLVVTRVPDDILAKILEFVYLGEVSIERSQIKLIVQWAENLGVDGLLDYLESNYTVNSIVLSAAEALQNLGKGMCPEKLIHVNEHLPMDCHTTPKHATSALTSMNQPSPGAQPPMHKVLDLHSLQQYKAAASRNFSRVSPSRSPTRGIKRSLMCSPSNMEDRISPAMPEHTAGHSREIVTKQEDPDSEDSDGELHIDEGPDDNSAMQYCEENMYVEESSEPQDLRVESRQPCSNNIVRPKEECLSSSNFILSTTTPMYLSSVYSTTSTPNILHTSNKTFTPSSIRSDIKYIPCSQNSNGLNELASAAALSNLARNAISVAKSPTNSGRISPRQKKKEKKYTDEQLAVAVDLVVNNQCQPVEAITLYKIPRRTFFRHLKNRRRQLGIVVVSKSSRSSSSSRPSSRPSSRTSSRDSSSPSSRPSSRNSSRDTSPTLESENKPSIFVMKHPHSAGQKHLQDLLNTMSANCHVITNTTVKRETISIEPTE